MDPSPGLAAADAAPTPADDSDSSMTLVGDPWARSERRRRPADGAQGGSSGQGQGQGQDEDEEEAAKERAHFDAVLHTFDSYLPYCLSANSLRRRSLYSLPSRHQSLLFDVGYKERLDAVDDRIRANYDVVKEIVWDARNVFMGDPSEDEEEEWEERPLTDGHNAAGSRDTDTSRTSRRAKSNRVKRPSDFDMDKLRSTLKQFVRDWSEEGAPERAAAYEPILSALRAEFSPLPPEAQASLRVLVPGAGLGRLSFDIARHGWACQGNEFSFYMLLASHFILNKTTSIHQHTLYPYVHTFSNLPTSDAVLKPVRVPDVLPSGLHSAADFSMVAGEFVEVYGQESEKGGWNAVATCYFIDTAKNIVRYLEVLNHVLCKGGIWVNVGPLLWHYENNNSGDTSIELTLDEMTTLVEKMGFRIEHHRRLAPQPYTGNLASMLQYQYTPAFWLARKVDDVEPALLP